MMTFNEEKCLTVNACQMTLISVFCHVCICVCVCISSLQYFDMTKDKKYCLYTYFYSDNTPHTFSTGFSSITR